MKTKKRTSPGPAPRGRHPGAVPPQKDLCPPSKDCAPKKVTGSVPLKCSSRPDTFKILVVTQEFGSKNCFFRRFCNKDSCFLWFHTESVEIRNEILCFLVHTLEFGALNFLCPPKFVYAPPPPPPPVTLS